jgi:D-3-phosphoglycerate dehydrogenase
MAKRKRYCYTIPMAERKYMKKIIFTTSSFDLDNFTDRDKVEAAGFELMVNPFGKRLTEEQVGALLDDTVVGMVAGVEPLTESVINNAKSLKVIARCGIGMDNVNVAAAKAKGISVYNTPDAPTRSVAELTLGHILSLVRRIPESDRMVRNKQWQPLMGGLLNKKTVGIIGFGRIGKMVAELIRAFGSRILVYDPYVKDGENVTHVTLEEILTQSDIITLHIPYSKETHHLIDSASLGIMKQNALLVNVARGGLVDDEALYQALEAGTLGGAALDCFETEPYIGRLSSLNKVQMSAHMGSYAKESRSMMEAEACAELVRGLKEHGLLS